MATATSRTAAAMPRLSSAIRARYSTVPAAARSTVPSASDSIGYPLAGVYPWPGRISRPASSEPRTARVPAASVTVVTTAALAASTVARRGMAASVVLIMPVPYSPLTASTATMATTAWPR